MSSIVPRGRGLGRMAAADSESVDVLIIGGGVVGCGSALDAALVDSRLLWLNVMIWPVRYVESVVAAWPTAVCAIWNNESFPGPRSPERTWFVARRLAPHLVRPVPFLTRLLVAAGNGRMSVSGSRSTTCSSPRRIRRSDASAAHFVGEDRPGHRARYQGGRDGRSGALPRCAD